MMAYFFKTFSLACSYTIAKNKMTDWHRTNVQFCSVLFVCIVVYYVWRLNTGYGESLHGRLFIWIILN